MPEQKKAQIADSADMIIDGYAFQRIDDNIRIVNLNTVKCSVLIIAADGKILEGDMDPIEQTIALDTWKDNSEFMGV